MMSTRCFSVTAVVILLIQFSVNVQETTALQACGQKLIELISLVCRFDSAYSRRYLEGTYKNSLMNKLDGNYITSPNIFRDLFTGKASDIYDAEYPHYRIAKGVVDECCRNPCSIETLQLYCP